VVASGKPAVQFYVDSAFLEAHHGHIAGHARLQASVTERPVALPPAERETP